MDLELVGDVAPMGHHGVDRDVETCGYLFVGQSAHHSDDYLSFARSEFFSRFPVGRLRFLSGFFNQRFKGCEGCEDGYGGVEPRADRGGEGGGVDACHYRMLRRCGSEFFQRFGRQTQGVGDDDVGL